MYPGGAEQRRADIEAGAHRGAVGLALDVRTSAAALEATFDMMTPAAWSGSGSAPFGPVLMDDVLTHLDPERRAGAAAVIADLATRHQVLYFTCHPEQVQALRDADPGLTEIELQRLV